MKLLRNSGGFTLTEILIVVAVVSVLAAISIPLYMSQQGKVEANQVDENVAQLLEMVTLSRMQGNALPVGDLEPGVKVTISGVGVFTPAQTMRVSDSGGEICVEAEVIDPDVPSAPATFRHRTESAPVSDGQCGS